MSSGMPRGNARRFGGQCPLGSFRSARRFRCARNLLACHFGQFVDDEVGRAEFVVEGGVCR